MMLILCVLMVAGFVGLYWVLNSLAADVREVNENICDLHEELVKAEVAREAIGRARGGSISPVQARLIHRRGH